MSRPFRHLSATAVAAIFAMGIAFQAGGLPSAWADDDGHGRGQDEDQGQSGPNDGLPVYLDHTVHSTAQDTCTPGFLWQGAGNPATTFQRKRNLDAGVELAIKAIFRQGPDIRSTYVDGDGLVHIEVPAGSQTTPAPNANRAAWNFTYSYDVALDPTNPMLDGWDAELWIDQFIEFGIAPAERRHLIAQPGQCFPLEALHCAFLLRPVPDASLPV